MELNIIYLSLKQKKSVAFHSIGILIYSHNKLYRKINLAIYEKEQKMYLVNIERQYLETLGSNTFN